MAGMPTVNVHQAKTQFSRLIDAAHAGETILLAKDGKPRARLMLLEADQPRRRKSLTPWKPPCPVDGGLDLPALLRQQGFQPLAVLLHHGIRAGGYPHSHRDPFDRLLAAQAELEGLQLVSLDPALASFPGRLLW
jgi:antitoxin (DNA-binding transcriptional repressor) of toxin-antitoxin stability system